MPKRLIIGVGNPLRGDDGFGIAVLTELAGRRLPDNVELADGGTQGVGLAALLHDCDEAVIIDAADMGKAPGALARFTPDAIRETGAAHAISLHDTDIASCLTLLHQLGREVKITIIAVQVADISLGRPMTTAVRDAIPAAVDLSLATFLINY